MKIFKNVKNQLDERQEDELLHIEKIGFWVTYWSLFVAIMIEIFLNFSIKQIAAEFLILMVISAYIVIACIKKGIWDRHLKPKLLTNLLLSLPGSIGIGIFSFARAYRYYNLSIMGDVVNFILYFAFTFILTFVVLQVMAFFYKKKKSQLEHAYKDDFDR